MGKMRVHQLAKELHIETTELVLKLQEMGINVLTHMNTLEEEEVGRVRKRFAVIEDQKEVIEEQRITSTVIRRRVRKTEPKEAAPKEVAPKEVVSEDIEEPEPEKIESPLPVVETATTETMIDEREKAIKVEEKPIEPEEKKPEVKEVELVKIIKKPSEKEKAEEKEDLTESVKKPEEKSALEKKTRKKLKGKRSEPAQETKHSPKKLVRKKREVIKITDIYKEEEKGELFRQARPKTKKEGPRGPLKKPLITTPKAIKRKIKIFEGVTVGELAKRMSIKASEVIKELMKLGSPATINQVIDVDAASLVASAFNYKVETISMEEGAFLDEKPDSPEDLVFRPPVVTVMGHVDHGKTLLLDTIRKTNVIGGEAGGITQHIGAYHVSASHGDIVFLDTPGHEAFTAMRARGAQVTDIVVLVVAADEGVKAQTEEAINHAKAAKVPIIVVINKIDKPNANPERIKQDLVKYELVPEDWGGDTIYVEISAKTGEGINELLEMILLQAEMLELKANPEKLARGVIIEARLDKTQGPVITALIQGGRLKIGDPFLAGAHFGKVRALVNDRGEKVTVANPSIPVEVRGISGVPQAGDIFAVLNEERKTRQIGLYRQQKQRESELTHLKRATTLEDLSDRIQKGEVKELKVIIKADVQGSIEALTETLMKCDTQGVKLKIIHKGVGTVTEMDVMLAVASDAIIICYNVKPDAKIQLISKQEKVDIRYYEVIYNVISDIENAMKGLLKPVLKEKLLGRAEIRSLFNVPKAGVVAGSFVTDGKMIRGSNIRLIRDSVVIYEGKMASLKRFKDDVKEVSSGFECGIGIQNFNNIESNDIIESYDFEEVSP